MLYKYLTNEQIESRGNCILDTGEELQESHNSLMTGVAERSSKIAFKKNPLALTAKCGKYEP